MKVTLEHKQCCKEFTHLSLDFLYVMLKIHLNLWIKVIKLTMTLQPPHWDSTLKVHPMIDKNDWNSLTICFHSFHLFDGDYFWENARRILQIWLCKAQKQNNSHYWLFSILCQSFNIKSPKGNLKCRRMLYIRSGGTCAMG